MKILVLAWEFPPRIVGGIARHVSELYPELVKLGHTIHLITVEFGTAPHYENIEGIHVHRVSVHAGNDFFHWVGNMNQSMGDYGGRLIREAGDFDLIHAHDWIVADASIALKQLFKIPLISTIHATEHGRYNGIHTPTHDYIAQKEKWLAHESWRVIVCTAYMRAEVSRVLATPTDKIDIVYNGIRAEKKQHPPHFDRLAFRRQFAADHQKIIYYVGRMTYEKGISVLINAIPKVATALQGELKVMIIGGGDTQRYQEQAYHLGIKDYCHFPGFMSDEDLDKFQTIADCAVFPSLYEPFGIVALESFAARVPVVVSNSGGLPEVVKNGETGIVTQVNHPDSLAQGILTVLQNPHLAKTLVDNAYHDLTARFQWYKLAQQTEAVYGLIFKQRQQVNW